MCVVKRQELWYDSYITVLLIGENKFNKILIVESRKLWYTISVSEQT